MGMHKGVCRDNGSYCLGLGNITFNSGESWRINKAEKKTENEMETKVIKHLYGDR